MTKEETIDMIIDDYKNGNQSAMSDYCDRTKCGECPLLTYVPCEHGIIEWLIDRLVKAEESQKAETNLEHYAIQSHTIRDLDISQLMFYDVDTLAIELKEGWQETFDWSDPIRWLLSPYEEPKQKFKLTQFEHDLLECYYVNELGIEDFWVTDHMYKKGYFKDIPTDIRIKDILDNCEVVEE